MAQNIFIAIKSYYYYLQLSLLLYMQANDVEIVESTEVSTSVLPFHNANYTRISLL